MVNKNILQKKKNRKSLKLKAKITRKLKRKAHWVYCKIINGNDYKKHSRLISTVTKKKAKSTREASKQ